MCSLAHSADMNLLLLQTETQSYKANYTTDIPELLSKSHSIDNPALQN